MKYEALRRIKCKVGKRKVKVASKVVACSCCGCVLTDVNRSFEPCLCKTCFDAEMAEIAAKDELEDSMTEAERLAEFLG